MKSRPYCMYQKEHRGYPVCSEQAQNRACAYPGHWCKVKEQTKQRLWREQGYQPRKVNQ